MKYLGKITDDKDLVTKEYVESLIAAIAAGDVSIADALGHFTATNVEDALEELYSSISSGGTQVTMNTWVASA